MLGFLPPLPSPSSQGWRGGSREAAPRGTPPCGASSGVTQVHVLVLFLKTLSLGFLDDVPALVELVNMYAHSLPYTCTRTCTQACTHRVHTGTRPQMRSPPADQAHSGFPSPGGGSVAAAGHEASCGVPCQLPHRSQVSFA